MMYKVTGYTKFTHVATDAKHYRTDVSHNIFGVRYLRRRHKRADDTKEYGAKVIERFTRMFCQESE